MIEYLAISAVLLLVYIGLAVSVALFHPDAQRRKDARSVLTTLVQILKRARR
ncbi:hypothetical protein [Saccharopolyspora sp. SCSIO 74807]|uniref:hypothetical protein n=1 Tax=Saccharopolyspora sp. SCSIO 74807 TaxID=3118084 RepID=UPI0030CCC73B